MTYTASNSISEIKAKLQAQLQERALSKATEFKADIKDANPEEVAEFLDMMQEVDAKQQDDRDIAAAQAIQAKREQDKLMQEIWGTKAY